MITVQLVFYIVPLVLPTAFLDSATSRPPARSLINLEHASCSGRSREARPTKILPRYVAKLVFKKQRCLSLLTASGPLITISHNEFSVKRRDAPGLLTNNLGNGNIHELFAIPKSNNINVMAEADPKKTSHAW